MARAESRSIMKGVMSSGSTNHTKLGEIKASPFCNRKNPKEKTYRKVSVLDFGLVEEWEVKLEKGKPGTDRS